MANPEHSAREQSLIQIVLAALGVVFGDIGTSPLYAIRECFAPAHGVPLSPENILGVLSLIFWSLTWVVSIKYLGFILKADNHGEGGIMALTAMLLAPGRNGASRKPWVVMLGLFGAALLYGDGIITPAISVLSAIEGLQIAAPSLKPLVIPLTVVILIALFWVQHRGTAHIGAIFGPATLIWLLTLIATGAPAIIRNPHVLIALNPIYALRFILNNGLHSFFILSAVVLCITGAEALYADMGHFGKRPIRLSWFGIVFPALLINYFGQGAIILAEGERVLENPFYALVSGWVLYPLVFLATIATVIASQALISGAFSLTQQAIQLGYLPRTHIEHTSHETEGQIYIGQVNWLLMLGCVTLVLIFRHSSNLAAAYGIAVTGTMGMTSILYYRVTRDLWNWPQTAAGALLAAFLAVDFAFFSANLRKVSQGGWIPILIAGALFLVMSTWKRGREALSRSMVERSTPLDRFITSLSRRKTMRVPGSAIFMTLNQDIAPAVLLHHFKHNQVLHERVILLSIHTRHVPQVSENERVKIIEMERGFYKVRAFYGYTEKPDISEILIYCLAGGLALDINALSFYIGRESFLTNGDSPLPLWRKKLFILLSRNARPATDYFGLPPDQVIEIGIQVAL